MSSHLLSAAIEKPSVTFLDTPDEAFMLATPWILGSLTFGLWILGQFGFSWNINEVATVLFSLIVMDALHINFTFIMMFSLPELQKWTLSKETREKNKSGWGRNIGPWGRSLIVAVALGVLFYFLKLSPYTSTLRGVATIFLMLELVGPAQHGIAQMRGISLIYNSNVRKNNEFTEEEKQRALNCEKLERFFFHMLLAGEIAYWIPGIFGFDRYQVPGMNEAHLFGGVMAVGAAFGILVNAYYFPRQHQTKKLAFLFRVLLWPLKMLNNKVAGLSLRATHGTEYLIIFRRMVKSSAITPQKRKRIYAATIGLSLIYAVIFGFAGPEFIKELSGKSDPTLLFSVALITTFVLRFTHYYTDSVLFRMGNPATRAAVSPLLGKPKAAATVADVSVPLEIAGALPGLVTAIQTPVEQTETTAG